MKNRRKRLLLAAFAFLFAIAPEFALAAETRISGGDTWITPFASEVDFKNDQPKKPSSMKPKTIEEANSPLALKTIISNHLYNRDTTYTVHYTGNTSTLKADINAAFTSIFNADDYLANCMKSYGYQYNGYVNDVTITFTSDYWATRAQEDQVNARVTEILSQIITPGMTNEQKERVIHDWIVANIAYDTSLTRHSAYDGVFGTKTTVCQGYALLTYKMLKEVGITNRIMVGYGHKGGYDPNAKEINNDAHAWNLVKLDNGNWVHLDSTWDDPLPDVPGRTVHTYYNVSEAEIAKVHTWKIDPLRNTDAPAWGGQTKQISITARDQYDNVVPNAQLYMDITITNKGQAETYTVNDKTYKSSATNLPAGAKTGTDGKTLVTIALPTNVDTTGDGITVIIKTKPGTKNEADYIGEPFVLVK